MRQTSYEICDVCQMEIHHPAQHQHDVVKPGTLTQAVDTWYRLHGADFDECEIREAIAHLQRLLA